MSDSFYDVNAELDALTETPSPTGGIPCAIARILSEVHGETADRVRRLIDETSVRSSSIAEVLELAGHPVSQQSVQRHRRRINKPGSGCRCPR